MFRDRKEAGQLLRVKIQQEVSSNHKFLNASPRRVVALPRGGVLVANEIGPALGCEINLLWSTKFGAPFQSGLAIGAVTSTGAVVIDKPLCRAVDVLDSFIERKRKELQSIVKKQEDHLLHDSGMYSKPDYKGTTVFLIDDGIATGLTALAAIRALKSEGAHQIIVAAPVVSQRAFALLRRECDSIIALMVPKDFDNPEEFYRDFHQVQDCEVIDILQKNTLHAAC